jgi:signal transduction histidine kinase
MPSIVQDWLVSAEGLGPLGPGQPIVLAIELVAELLITAAWLAILVLLVVLVVKRRDLLVRQAYLMGGAVFLLNAVAPLLIVLSLWLPVGTLAIVIEALSGVILASAAFVLWRRLPQTLSMPSGADLHAANLRLEAEIRERNAAQAALAALNTELEARVTARTAELTATNAELVAEISERHELTTELARARDQAEGANRVKSMFLASMSHDLRTPLNAIIGFSEMILEEVRGPINHPKYQAYIEDIHRSGYLLLSLINNILDLSKIEAGKHELAPILVDGQQIAEDCVALIAGQSGFSEIEPSIAVQGDGLIYVDELALRQILLNLVGNAAKFTPAGGQIAIVIGHGEDGSRTLRVTDTGIGMDEKGIRKALEPFGQATLTARPRGSGSGLGLTIVTRLVEAHGGRFAIDSAPSYGTTVRIWLPGPPVIERGAASQDRRLAELSAGPDHQDFVVR